MKQLIVFHELLWHAFVVKGVYQMYFNYSKLFEFDKVFVSYLYNVVDYERYYRKIITISLFCFTMKYEGC